MDPKLLQLIAGGAGRTGTRPPSGAGMPPPMPGHGAPPGAPMSTPQPAQGDKQSAMVNIHIAMDMLAQTIQPLGPESEEGRTVMTCLQNLSKKFGESKSKSQELVPAELMQLMQTLPQAGGMSPEAKAMGQQPMQIPGQPPGQTAGGAGGMPPMPGMQPHPMAA